jgi:hypothetical protein
MKESADHSFAALDIGFRAMVAGTEPSYLIVRLPHADIADVT